MNRLHKLRKTRFALSLVVVLALLIGTVPGLGGQMAEAKTDQAKPGETIFFYATNKNGENVLLKVMSLSELSQKAHGQLSQGIPTGENYYFSYTDNLPAPGYMEAKGLTLPELVEYVAASSPVTGASGIDFSETDRLHFMSTDGSGTYGRSHSYEDFYQETRYYFPGLFDEAVGWNSGWEISDDKYQPTDPKPIPLEVYKAEYQDKDSYFNKKKAVFQGGTEMPVLLAVESQSGRKQELSGPIAANGGVVTGCLKDELSADTALRLCLSQTEAALMSGNRTAHQNFSWVYNIKLEMGTLPDIRCAGTVAAPEVTEWSVSPDGNTLTFSLSCATEGASIYYSLEDSAPQTLYKKPVTVDISSQDIAASPVAISMTAVKEGCWDQGIVSNSIPRRAPAFTTVTPIAMGSTALAQAASSVSAEDFADWAKSIETVQIKPPAASSYETVDMNRQLTINDEEKTVTFGADLFPISGAYSVKISAKDYGDRVITINVRKAAPTVTTETYYMGYDMTMTFPDNGYQSDVKVQITDSDGQNAKSIANTYLEKTTFGRLTIKASYFSSKDCAIKAPGTYRLILTNNAYLPASQTLEIQIKDASQRPEDKGFGYVLSTNSLKGKVGDTVMVRASLSSDGGEWLLHGGQYGIVLDQRYVKLKEGSLKSVGPWECKAVTDPAKNSTHITFLALDESGKGLACGHDTALGSFEIQLTKAGTSVAALQCAEAILTDGVGGGISMVKGSGLSLTIQSDSPSGPGGGGGGSAGGEIPVYTIRFDTGGGTSLAPINVVSGDTILIDQAPTKPGHLFAGWYEDAQCKVLVSGTYEPKANATLYAKWDVDETYMAKRPVGLEWQKHTAYLAGYGDGTVRPEKPITREETVTVFYRLLTEEKRAACQGGENDFKDVADSRWSANAISSMVKGGYIKGYEDRTFRPEKPITRGEFASLAAQFIKAEEGGEGSSAENSVSYGDIKGCWAGDDIIDITVIGWIKGYEDGSFRPEQPITRAEAATIINRMLDRRVDAAGLHADTRYWKDNLRGSWYYYEILEAVNSHEYEKADSYGLETWTSISPM